MGGKPPVLAEAAGSKMIDTKIKDPSQVPAPCLTKLNDKNIKRRNRQAVSVIVASALAVAALLTLTD